MMSIISFILGTVCILTGMFVLLAAVIGNYKFKYVLNRMQASATQDTLGILFVLTGLAFYSGFSFTTLKLLFVIAFFWLSSPTCSHLLVRMEISTNPNLLDEVEVIEE